METQYDVWSVIRSECTAFLTLNCGSFVHQNMDLLSFAIFFFLSRNFAKCDGHFFRNIFRKVSWYSLGCFVLSRFNTLYGLQTLLLQQFVKYVSCYDLVYLIETINLVLSSVWSTSPKDLRSLNIAFRERQAVRPTTALRQLHWLPVMAGRLYTVVTVGYLRGLGLR